MGWIKEIYFGGHCSGLLTIAELKCGCSFLWDFSYRMVRSVQCNTGNCCPTLATDARGENSLTWIVIAHWRGVSTPTLANLEVAIFKDWLAKC